MLESMRQHEAFIFPALGHPTPVAIVEFLSHCEMSVSQSCESFGVEQANASQYLAVLWSKHIVETRREGNQIFDRPRGPRLAKVLAKIRDYFNARITEATEMFRDEQTVAIKNTQETGR